MNKEEYAIDEKTYENYDGLKIKIIFSNLGRRYKKIGDNLSLMLEKETVKLEDSLTAMIRITKENEEIDRKTEIKKIKQQAKKEVQQLEEVKNTKIIELDKELAILKEMYEIKQKEKEQKTKLANEIIKSKEKLQLQDELEEKEENSQDNLPEIRIDEINDDDLEQHSETSETYTELLANIDNTKNLEINTGDVDMDEKPNI